MLQDCAKLCEILNVIIEIGGTTAYQQPLDVDEFAVHFMTGADCIDCVLAESQGTLVGFQALSKHPELPKDCANIATFARGEPKIKGVGTALFDATKQRLNGATYTWVNATIRADNQSGLAYYTKMGFADYSVAKAVPLQDGTEIDRVSKKYIL